MTETLTPNLENGENLPLGAYLERLGEEIEMITLGYDDVHLFGSRSRRVDLDERTKLALIYKEEGLAGIGADIIIQKEAIENIGGKDTLRSYVLRWPKDFALIEEEQSLTITSLAAKKDKKRVIKGKDLNKYSKDLDLALELVRQTEEALRNLGG